MEVEEEKVADDDKKPAEEPKPTTIPEMEASKKETPVFHYARKYRTPLIPKKRPPPDRGAKLPEARKKIVPSDDEEESDDDDTLPFDPEEDFNKFYLASLKKWDWRTPEEHKEWVEDTNTRLRRMMPSKKRFELECKLESTVNQWKQGKRQLRREWALTRKGVIVALKYNNDSEFTAKTIKQIDENTSEPTKYHYMRLTYE